MLIGVLWCACEISSMPYIYTWRELSHRPTRLLFYPNLPMHCHDVVYVISVAMHCYPNRSLCREKEKRRRAVKTRHRTTVQQFVLFMQRENMQRLLCGQLREKAAQQHSPHELQAHPLAVQ